MEGLKPCPFCGGKARLSFKDAAFAGQNCLGDKKVQYRFQVICNKCHSRGKPVKTDFLINPNPWGSLWANRQLPNTGVVAERTETLRPWAEKAIEAWNGRSYDE